MPLKAVNKRLENMQALYPEKFAPLSLVFNHIHPGNRIFIATGCAEPQYLVRSMIDYVRSHPKAFFDAEILQVWTLGVAPYADEKFKAASIRSFSRPIGPPRAGSTFF